MAKTESKQPSQKEGKKADEKPVGPKALKNSDCAEKHFLVGVKDNAEMADKIMADQVANDFKKNGVLVNVKGHKILLDKIKTEVAHMCYDVKKMKGRWAKFQFVEDYKGKKLILRKA